MANTSATLKLDWLYADDGFWKLADELRNIYNIPRPKRSKQRREIDSEFKNKDNIYIKEIKNILDKKIPKK